MTLIILASGSVQEQTSECNCLVFFLFFFAKRENIIRWKFRFTILEDLRVWPLPKKLKKQGKIYIMHLESKENRGPLMEPQGLGFSVSDMLLWNKKMWNFFIKNECSDLLEARIANCFCYWTGITKLWKQQR